MDSANSWTFQLPPRAASQSGLSKPLISQDTLTWNESLLFRTWLPTSKPGNVPAGSMTTTVVTSPPMRPGMLGSNCCMLTPCCQWTAPGIGVVTQERLRSSPELAAAVPLSDHAQPFL